MENNGAKNILDVEFVCDEDYVARFWFGHEGMYVDTANKLWEKDQQSYACLMKFPLSNLQGTIELLNELKKEPFFNNLVSEAVQTKKEMSGHFAENKAKLERMLQEKLRFDFEIPKAKCYCMPRGYRTGQSNLEDPNCTKIVFGHPGGKNNAAYDSVYVLHEMLHGVFDGRVFSHAIIQFISDFEAGIELNGKPYEGHDYLMPLMEQMLPYWNLFVGRSKEEIAQVCDAADMQYDIDKFEKYRKELSKMKFSEFYEWIKTQQNANSNIRQR